MAGSVKDEIWAWKGISEWRKQADIILFIILWAVWKERDKKVFERVDDGNDFDMIRNM